MVSIQAMDLRMVRGATRSTSVFSMEWLDDAPRGSVPRGSEQ